MGQAREGMQKKGCRELELNSSRKLWKMCRNQASEVGGRRGGSVQVFVQPWMSTIGGPLILRHFQSAPGCEGTGHIDKESSQVKRYWKS